MNNKKQLPVFKNEDDEREFWATHDLTDVFDPEKRRIVAFPNLQLATETITLRVSSPMLEGLKALAHKRDVPYQSLMKQWLAEKLQAERASRVKDL